MLSHRYSLKGFLGIALLLATFSLPKRTQSAWPSTPAVDADSSKMISWSKLQAAHSIHSVIGSNYGFDTSAYPIKRWWISVKPTGGTAMVKTVKGSAIPMDVRTELFAKLNNGGTIVVSHIMGQGESGKRVTRDPIELFVYK